MVRILFVAIAFLASISNTSLCRAESRPNIIVFYVDDMGWADWQRDSYLNPNGGLLYETPNLIELARQGFQVRNAYASSPVCTPSRASLFTGMSPARHGMTQLTHKAVNLQTPTMRDTLLADDNGSIRWKENLPLGNTLAEVLSLAGYKNAFFGKWHLSASADHASADPLNAGFDVAIGGGIQGSPSGFGGFFARDDGAWKLPGLRAKHGSSHKPDRYLSDVLTEKAGNFIEESALENTPFFVLISHYDVHTPNEIPSKRSKDYSDYLRFKQKRESLISEGYDLKRHNNPSYAWKLKKVDDSLGRILSLLNDPNGDGIKSDNIKDDTVIFFTSDNGGEASSTSNFPLRSVKGSCYEGGVRVPFVVSWTGNSKFQRGRVDYQSLVTTEDIYATVLELANAPCNENQREQLDGVDLCNLLEGASHKRDCVIWHYPHLANGNHDGIEFYSAIRVGAWKLIYFYDQQKYELYNLDEDISESNNVVKLREDMAIRLSAKLKDYLMSVGAVYPIKQGGDVDLEVTMGIYEK